MVSKTKTAWITGTVVHPRGRKLVKHKHSFPSAIAPSPRSQFVLLREDGIQRVRYAVVCRWSWRSKHRLDFAARKTGFFVQSVRMTAKFVGDWVAWFFPQQAAKSLMVGPGDFL